MHPKCRLFRHLLILFLVLGPLAAARGAEPTERLLLKSGQQYRGVHRGFADAGIVWERPDGTRMTIALEDVERIDYPLPGMVPKLERSARVTTFDNGESITEYDSDDPGAGWNPWELTHDSVDDLFNSTVDGFVEWTQRVELGGRFLDGNSDEDFINAGGKFERRHENSVGQLDFTGQYGRSDGDVTTNRWNGNATYDYGREGNWIVYAAAKNEYDEFENLDYRGTYSSGVGYRFFNEKDRRCIVRLGPAITWEVFRDPVVNRTTPDGLGELEIVWPIFKRSSFETKTTVHPSLEDIGVVRLISTNGLMFELDEHGRWKLKLGFRFEYNSRPNENRLPADYTSSVLLVYSRK